jgi:hypothetical protein
MTRNNKILGLAIVVASLLSSAQASAALLTIGAGTPFNTPGSNNTMGAGVPLIDGASLVTTQANVILEFRYLGSESGFSNKLVVMGLSAYGPLAGNFTHTEAARNNTNPNAKFPGTFVGGGLQGSAGGVGMSFDTQTSAGIINLGPVVHGKSIALAYLDVACVANPAKFIKDCVSGTATNAVLFALDDSGAGPDDNHDDYVGYVVATPVPVPAAAWLLGSALLGLFGIGRRRAS